MAATNKVGIVEGQEWASGRQEFRVIDDLHSIATRIEKILPPQMAENLYESHKRFAWTEEQERNGEKRGEGSVRYHQFH